MDSWFVIMLIGAGVLSAAGPIVWASTILRAGVGTPPWPGTPGGDLRPGTPPNALTYRLDSMLAQLDKLVRSASRRSGGPDGVLAKRPPVSPFKQLRIQNMFMETHAIVRRLDETSRRRYEARIADLSRLAASAGIHWSPLPH